MLPCGMNEHSSGYRCWARSHRGHVRSANEDAFAVSPTNEAMDQWSGFLPAREGWALLADGMGGHAGGDVASRLAVDSIRVTSNLLFDEDGVEAAVAAIHASMFSAMRQSPDLWGMGTTIAGVALSPNHALCFNVGDSRIYHFGSTLSLVSEDHVIDGHILTQCIGGTSELDVPEPALIRIVWKKGQRLLLCSDGLTDMVADEEIAAIMRRERESPAVALINAALDAGGRDNVTVVVIEKLD